VEILEKDRPAGVILVSAHAADLLNWPGGESQRIARVTEEPEAVMRQRTGAIAPRGPRGRRDHAPA
jgi:hypothetical protein